MGTTDRDALLALYWATQGAEWTNKQGWDTSVELGEWYGVTVNEQGRVTQLDLNENNLTGTPRGLHKQQSYALLSYTPMYVSYHTKVLQSSISPSPKLIPST